MRPKNDSITEKIWRDKFLALLERIPAMILLTAAAFIIGTVFIVRNVRKINRVSEMSMQTRAILPEEGSLLDGIYCVKSLDGDAGINSSAEISGADGEFQITIYGDYSPLYLEAELLSEGTLYSYVLGEGRITYKPSTGAIKIKFIKGDTEICEFTK